MMAPRAATISWPALFGSLVSVNRVATVDAFDVGDRSAPAELTFERLRELNDTLSELHYDRAIQEAAALAMALPLEKNQVWYIWPAIQHPGYFGPLEKLLNITVERRQPLTTIMSELFALGTLFGPDMKHVSEVYFCVCSAFFLGDGEPEQYMHYEIQAAIDQWNDRVATPLLALLEAETRSVTESDAFRQLVKHIVTLAEYYTLASACIDRFESRYGSQERNSVGLSETIPSKTVLSAETLNQESAVTAVEPTNECGATQTTINEVEAPVCDEEYPHETEEKPHKPSPVEPWFAACFDLIVYQAKEPLSLLELILTALPDNNDKLRLLIGREAVISASHLLDLSEPCLAPYPQLLEAYNNATDYDFPDRSPFKAPPHRPANTIYELFGEDSMRGLPERDYIHIRDVAPCARDMEVDRSKVQLQFPLAISTGKYPTLSDEEFERIVCECDRRIITLDGPEAQKDYERAIQQVVRAGFGRAPPDSWLPGDVEHEGYHMTIMRILNQFNHRDEKPAGILMELYMLGGNLPKDRNAYIRPDVYEHLPAINAMQDTTVYEHKCGLQDTFYALAAGLWTELTFAPLVHHDEWSAGERLDAAANKVAQLAALDRTHRMHLRECLHWCRFLMEGDARDPKELMAVLREALDAEDLKRVAKQFDESESHESD